MNPDGESYDSGRVSYALMLSEKEGAQTTNLPGYYDMCSFYYPKPDSFQIESPDGHAYVINPYTFIAESPDGQFTEEETKEIIAILSSYRLADKATMSRFSEQSSEHTDSKAATSIDELWEKLDGTWECIEYTYMGSVLYDYDTMMKFRYVDGMPCMSSTVHTTTGEIQVRDVQFYDISVIDEYHYNVYMYKRGSYNGTNSPWSDDILLVWYSIDLSNISDGELMQGYHISFEDGFVDNHMFKYRLVD